MKIYYFLSPKNYNTPYYTNKGCNNLTKNNTEYTPNYINHIIIHKNTKSLLHTPPPRNHHHHHHHQHHHHHPTTTTTTTTTTTPQPPPPPASPPPSHNHKHDYHNNHPHHTNLAAIHWRPFLLRWGWGW